MSRALIACVLCTTLAACGGGGAAAPAGPAVTSASTTGMASIAFSINVPSTQSNARQPQYISGATKSAVIQISSSVGGTPVSTTINCQGSCSADVSAPVGSDTFAVSLYSGSNGTGSLLSQGTTTANILAGQTNTVAVAFGGVVNKIALGVAHSTLTTGSKAQLPLTVTAYDAAGDAIVGTDAFSSPIVLTDSDKTGATSLSATTLTTPSSTAAINFTGANFSSAVISASINGTSMTATPVTLTAVAPVAQAPVVIASAPVSNSAASSSGSTAGTTPVSIPVTGAIPAHMKVYAQLPGNYHNQQGVQSAAQAQSDYRTLAKYVDYMETDNRASNYAHTAGIKVGFYTDPIQAHGAELSWPASAFAHDCNGNLVVPNYSNSPELLGDVNSATHTQAWDAEIGTHLQDQWGTYTQDWVRSDDSSYPGEESSGFFASVFGGTREPAGVPYCGYSNASFMSGLLAMYAQSPLPVLFNGATDPSYVAFAQGQSNVMGAQCESCFGGWTGSTWQNHVNAEIAFVGAHKIFESFSHGNGTAAQQLYLYASMLLGFDPNYTVLSMDISTPSGMAMTPLALLVPLEPTVTAATVSGYAQPEGVYVRQFGACFIAQAQAGPCAVVVNADTASHKFPAVLAGYHHTVNVSGSGIVREFGDNGAVAANGAAPPSTIGAMTATIVFN